MDSSSSLRIFLVVLVLILAANLIEIIIPPIFSSANFSYENYSEEDAFVVQRPIIDSTSKLKSKNIMAWVTAYSSEPEQTDETPFIAASGNYVYFGTAASNFLPFGTKFRIPEVFGSQIFIVEDRMNKRFNDRIDIWFPTKEEAKKFGKRYLKIEIL